MKKNEQSLWDRMKCINIYLTVFPEGEREEQEVHMKTMVNIFPNFMENINLKTYEAS